MEPIILQSSFVSIAIFNVIAVFLAVIAGIVLKGILRIKIDARASEAFVLSVISFAIVALVSLYLFYDATITRETKEIALFIFGRLVRYSAILLFVWASSTISSRLILLLYQLSRKKQSLMSES